MPENMPVWLGVQGGGILHSPNTTVKRRSAGPSGLFAHQLCDLLQIPRTENVMAIDHGTGLTAGDRHRHAFVGPGVDHVPGGRPPELLPRLPAVPAVRC
ncbi:MAG TPA: hypothetical protein VLM91_12965, partial [Candidatus Methylomirabilis sp.]|nr:hypothetical protein [Candidatus Methylomirabilis sp.]